jgi:poly-gamma-glutamate synthesis protein (capsule biosynthesis protein)
MLKRFLLICALLLSVMPRAATAAGSYYYALVAPFPTLADDVSSAALRAFWAGDAKALAGATNTGTAPTLFMTAETQKALTAALGAPGKSAQVKVLPAGEILQAAWAVQPSGMAVVPFEQLEARWKLLTIDGINLLDKTADVAAYPLVAQASATNRDLNKMTVVAMTGVTALFRGTAFQMERKGITYPAQKIVDWLKNADITHISNEVSFWDKCPKPKVVDGVTMCSDPKYIELLQFVGTDIVELSGNHLWDRGADKLTTTIETYEKLGWKYFAGGKSAATALDPVRYDINGSKIAFVGCNWFGNNWATDTKPGSARCGAKGRAGLELIIPAIQKLKAEGYMVIVGIQYGEFDRYDPTPQQARDFNALREAGAIVVNGSQGHHAAGFSVNAQGFIHYGVGNLFFGDQAGLGNQQTMVDRHVFYDNRYLGVEIKTARIRDLSQPQPMNVKERRELLTRLFAASTY